MTKFLDTLLNGITVGSLYGLIALGYTMVYGILQFINFAHGDIVMCGAWIAFLIVSGAGWAATEGHPFAAGVIVLVGSMLACATLGLIIERGAYRPLRNAPRLNVLITAIGVSLLIQNTGQLPWIFGTEPQPMAMLLPRAELGTWLGVTVQSFDLLIIAIAVGLMGGLDFLVFRTQLGIAMRATSFNRQVAALMGVPVERIVGATFVVGSALAAVGGFLFATKYGIVQQPADMSWVLLGLKAFVAAVVGGIGNVRGAMIGGLLIGLLELFGAAYLSPALRDVYCFSVLILVLLIRPAGLLGQHIPEKV